MQRELLKERMRCRALEEELENPMNIHRWRKLEVDIGRCPHYLRCLSITKYKKHCRLYVWKMAFFFPHVFAFHTVSVSVCLSEKFLLVIALVREAGGQKLAFLSQDNINTLKWLFSGQWPEHLWADPEDSLLTEASDNKERRSGWKRAFITGKHCSVRLICPKLLLV